MEAHRARGREGANDGNSQSEPTPAGRRPKIPRGYCFRFADVFLRAGPFAEGFLAADFAAADFVRMRAAGFRFGLSFACAALPAFAPAMPPTTAPTAAPSAPKSDPNAAPAATPPAVPKFEVVSPDFISAFWSSPFPVPLNEICAHSDQHLDIMLYRTVGSESAEIK